MNILSGPYEMFLFLKVQGSGLSVKASSLDPGPLCMALRQSRLHPPSLQCGIFGTREDM